MDVTGFPHQVGGHFGLLTCSGHVCKPLNQREYSFYQQITPNLQSFTPKFCGRVRVNLSTSQDGTVYMSTDQTIQCHSPKNTLCVCDNDEVSTSTSTEDSNVNDEKKMTFRLRNKRVEAESVTNAWAGQCQSKVVQKLFNGYDKWFIVIEDMVSAFAKPCVIDLKMGTRQYGDDASAQKRLSQHQKCRQSTSEEMGVRMVGMQLYDRRTKSYVYVNKYEGRRMDRLQFISALTVFFRSSGTQRSKKFLERLLELSKVMSSSEGYRFFSSSLLIAFDDSPTASSDVVVSMIDFAHSTFPGFLEDKVYEGMDEGYLLGINSLCTILCDIIEDLNAEIEEGLVPSPDWNLVKCRKRKFDLESATEELTVPELLVTDSN
ncbi:unnamed protein product [Bursaphelenchus okinawaensis]|uniref:Kinase n=1 Tax=Bursaphelenchus okinawaensis TaxID=465554 RepID=A0A811JTN3_9BILA|nr:unnamed protein product [Bursaphelenchus okinawaensis]CAG9083277.1 unnamed protein product [Bursaphelenchus okinawaensis]